jgi:isocitrate lyase
MDRTMRLLEELLVNRHIKPEAKHYKALILAHAKADHGNALGVRKVLKEMEREGVAVDGGVLHAALRVCFVCMGIGYL